MSFLSKSKQTAPPAESMVEKAEKGQAQAEVALRDAQDRLSKVQLLALGADAETFGEALTKAFDDVEKAENNLKHWARTVQTARVQFKEEHCRALEGREKEAWAEIEKRLGPQMLKLAKEVDSHIDSAAMAFWKILDLNHEAVKVAPKTEGHIGDSPAGDAYIQSYFKRHLRKHEFRWAYPHYEQRTDNLGTFSDGIKDSVAFLLKMKGNRLLELQGKQNERPQ